MKKHNTQSLSYMTACLLSLLTINLYAIDPVVPPHDVEVINLVPTGNAGYNIQIGNCVIFGGGKKPIEMLGETIRKNEKILLDYGQTLGCDVNEYEKDDPINPRRMGGISILPQAKNEWIISKKGYDIRIYIKTKGNVSYILNEITVSPKPK